MRTLSCIDCGRLTLLSLQVICRRKNENLTTKWVCTSMEWTRLCMHGILSVAI